MDEVDVIESKLNGSHTTEEVGIFLEFLFYKQTKYYFIIYILSTMMLLILVYIYKLHCVIDFSWHIYLLYY